MAIYFGTEYHSCRVEEKNLERIVDNIVSSQSIKVIHSSLGYTILLIFFWDYNGNGDGIHYQVDNQEFDYLKTMVIKVAPRYKVEFMQNAEKSQSQ